MDHFLEKHWAYYVKDNPEGYWFKRKLYGWGWTPVTKEGWTVMAGWLILVILNSFRLEKTASADFANWFVLETLALSLILLVICYKKGEKPRWQWGLSKDQLRD
ncbi:MAG TPA: hypothetical protein VFS75_03110 [Candidatus Paceibacterota bacterium]|nr:hypothetical protein [Candidatus Paceibacterota bacterium]